MYKVTLTSNQGGWVDLSRVSFLIGKNGCGKSTRLRDLEQFVALPGNSLPIRKLYISPERGGQVSYQPNIEQNMASNPSWISDSRRRNQSDNFRQQSAALFRQLEINVLRRIEQDQSVRANFSYNFETYLDEINNLLDAIRVERADLGFKLFSKTTHQSIEPQSISSGESELISLAMDCLAFELSHKTESHCKHLIILDEPDVHLHPDLQHRFGEFLLGIVKRSNIDIIIATHSTSILWAFNEYEDSSICFMKSNDKTLTFLPVSKYLKEILPIFGAHPLSAIFSRIPILLVEGDDDVRVWQQIQRSSEGRIRLYPISVGGICELNPFEKEVDRILGAVYENSKAYSIRDLDEAATPDIVDQGSVTRLKLNCRSIENIILTDESLTTLGWTWDTFIQNIQNLTEDFRGLAELKKIILDSTFNRRTTDIKQIRQVILALSDTTKPWEVHVGQIMAKALMRKQVNPGSENSIVNFLGKNVVSTFSLIESN